MTKIDNIINHICSECGWTTSKQGSTIIICDYCKKEQTFGVEEWLDGRYLSMTVFHEKYDDHEEKHYCSWECCLKDIAIIKDCDFLSFPHATFQEKYEKHGKSTGKSVRDCCLEGLQDAIKKIYNNGEQP